MARRHSSCGRMSFYGAAILAALLSPATASFAMPAWESAGSGSVAILPPPVEAEGIVGASLACAEQEWTLLLRTGQDWRNGLRTGDTAPMPVAGAAEVTIGKARHALTATRLSGSIALSLPYGAIEPLRTGTVLGVEITGAAGPASARFSLNGSKRVLDAVWPLCSPRSMEGYDLVAVSDSDPSVPDAGAALDKDIAAFRLATQSDPKLEAASVSLSDGRALMVTRLCGSSWYFGRSGCNVSAFTRSGPAEAWVPAYENEGSTTYLDRTATTDGWPNIVAVPLKGKPDLSEFRWDGAGYTLDHALMAQDQYRVVTD